MELKVRIRTPEGMAKKGGGFKHKVLRKLLFRKAKITKEEISKDQAQIIWTMDVHLRHWKGICRNITAFQAISRKILDHKRVMKGLKKLADSPEDYETVKTMITDGTTVEIIKQADIQELSEV